MTQHETSRVGESLKSKTVPQPADRVWNLVLAVTITGIAVLFAGWSKPIWIDEFLHFATGAMSWTDLLRTIDYTTIEINHGQTGTYILVDWLLLQLFGASAFALRLPSLLSAILLMASAVFIIRYRRLGRLWEFAVLLTLAAHTTLMSFTAEARPYMPLAASAVAMVLLFMAPPNSAIPDAYRGLGIVGLFLGALMQAYWPLLLAFGLFFGVVVQIRDGRRWSSAREFITSFSLVWVAAAVVAYVLVGQLTWMRRSAEFGYDPFQWFGTRGEAIASFWRMHLFLGVPPIVWTLIAVSALIAVIVCFRQVPSLLSPVVLVLGGLATSAVLSGISISRGYWIFERQWVAGVALCAVGSAWFFGELWKLGRRTSRAALAAPIIFVGTIVWAVALSFSQVVAEHEGWIQDQEVFSQDQRLVEELFAVTDDQAVVYAANVNIARGGKIWPQFTDWYRGQAGMRPEFREKNPSWTEWIWGSDGWTEGSD